MVLETAIKMIFKCFQKPVNKTIENGLRNLQTNPFLKWFEKHAKKLFKMILETAIKIISKWFQKPVNKTITTF